MPNVRLRTIINQDNSTTFQVQFQQGGEWEDLTWDMISDKPFESLDDTVFLVDENGVLTITDVHTVANWSDVLDKPFIFLDSDDFSVSESGVLSYTGSLDWTTGISGKPFTTIDNNDFIVVDGELQIRPKTIECDWSSVDQKPFSYLDTDDFSVENDVLKVNFPTPPTPSVDWSDITNKPLNSIGNGLSVNLQGELSADAQDWSDITNKPLNSIGSGLSVNLQGELSADAQDWSVITNKPLTSIGNGLSVDSDGELSADAQDWSDITNKPLTSIGNGLSVDSDGELSADTQTPEWSTEVLNKPFETLNSSDFSVDPDTGELSLAGGGGGGNPDWQDVQNKPFNTIDTTNLNVYNGALRCNPHMWFEFTMSNDHKITTKAMLNRFVLNFFTNSYKKRFGLDNPFTGYFGGADDNKIYHVALKMRIDNTQTDLTGVNASYDVTIEYVGYRMYQSDASDTYFVQFKASGMPAVINGTTKTITIEGICRANALKTDGVVTAFGGFSESGGYSMRYIEDAMYYPTNW